MTERDPIKAARVELADAWQSWDDAIAKQNARASATRKKTFDARETQRVTERVETAAAEFGRSIGLPTNDVRELMQAMRRLGWERERALKSIETIGNQQRRNEP